MLPMLRHFEPVQRRQSWDNLGRILDEFWPDRLFGTQSIGLIDLYEDEEKLHIEAELPGYQRDDINLILENNILHLEAERHKEQEDKGKNYYIREREQGKWARIVRLPVAVEPDKVEALFENGVLKITLEKQQKNKTRKIEVK